MSLNTIWYTKRVARKKARLSHAYLIYNGKEPLAIRTNVLCSLNEGFGPYLVELDMALRIEVPFCPECCKIVLDKLSGFAEKTIYIGKPK